MKKKSKLKLGVSDKKLASAINETLEIQTTTSAVINELIRGFRTHFLQFLKSEEIEGVDLDQSKLGLAHLFSRSKISLDVNRNDKPIIQSISLIELLDKDINTFSMRVKEWYSWHYPELARIVSDNNVFVKLAQLVGNRDTTTATLEEIEEICGDAEIAEKVLESYKNSMGQEISEFDIQCLTELCDKTLKMYNFRTEIQGYLKNRMEIVSPNLTELIGETVAAKLISHSGSLSTLAKYPASTIQILGAEKALFRALKEKTKTPKYGLLYNTSFIGRAIGKNKGKISRFLANKCAMAARLDHFLINPTNRFGEKLKEQVEKRLEKPDDKDDV
jgi:nucleolar protein 56